MRAYRWALLCIFLAILTLTARSPGLFGWRRASASSLSIVVIVSDDQRVETLQYMSKTMQLIADQGVRFTNGFVSTPLCCPSRASILTGQFTHNHGVFSNINAPQTFNDSSTIAVWLQGAGYHTGMFGKYLNGWSDYLKQHPGYVPPGWNAFEQAIGYGTQSNYSPIVMANKAIDFIKTTPSDQPVFVYYAPAIPHAPAIPQTQYAGTFSTFPNWRPPSFNEADVSDKPSWVRKLKLLTEGQIAAGDATHRRQLETLQSLDDAVALIVDALIQTGRLDSTAIIVTSDHGLSWGEHRWLDAKECVYDPCVRVPFLVRAPGVAARTDDHPVLNVDIAVTIAAWAGVTPPTIVNGMNLIPLLADPATPWRDVVLLEHLVPNKTRAFYAVHSGRDVYVEYANGEREYYDLTTDPDQLTNAYSNPLYVARIDELQTKLNELKTQ